MIAKELKPKSPDPDAKIEKIFDKIWVGDLEKTQSSKIDGIVKQREQN